MWVCRPQVLSVTTLARSIITRSELTDFWRFPTSPAPIVAMPHFDLVTCRRRAGASINLVDLQQLLEHFDHVARQRQPGPTRGARQGLQLSFWAITRCSW